MSFFDEGDEPTRVTARPARPRRPATASRPAGRRPDRQTVRIRQAMLVGGLILILVLIIIGISSCVSSRAERALKDYNRDVTAVINDSDQQVGKPFFQLMANGASEGEQLQVQVSQLRQGADEDVKRAEGFSVPGEMRPAHDKLMLVLHLRAEALEKIAAQLPAALGGRARQDQALAGIAGEMQEFLASDVIYNVRVAPLIKDALDKKGITGQTISNSRFLDDIAWLSEGTVAARLGQSDTGSTTTGGVTPGLHGHGLLSVAVGTTTLQPGGTTNRVTATNTVTFSVKFANQGDNDESNVKVNIRISSGGKTIANQTKTISQTKSKQEVAVDIPITQTLPAGAAIVDVSITPVRGEEKTDNNRASYTVIFQR